jgi:MYXO-CTERM domain-containing protein
MSATVFNFDSLSPDQSTPFTYTVNGVTANFSSSTPFWVEPYDFQGGPLASGNNLFNHQTGPPVTLNILFSVYATSISLTFAWPPLTFTERAGGLSGTVVGTQSLYGTRTGPGTFGNYPVGVLSFSGGSFNAIQITANAVPAFQIDNITYGNSAATPEPGPAWLTISALVGGLALRRRRQRSH